MKLKRFLSSLFSPKTRAGKTRLAAIVTVVGVFTGINFGPLVVQFDPDSTSASGVRVQSTSTNVVGD